MVKLQDLELPEAVFENVLIGFHLKCMRYFGYIISKQQQNKRFHLWKGALLIASLPIFCCLNFIAMFKGFHSLANGSLSLATAFAYLSISIATASAFFQRRRFVRIVRFLHEDITEIFRIADTEEEVMLAKTIQYLRAITSAMWIPVLVADFLVIMECFCRTLFKPETVFNMPEVMNGTAQPILLFRLFPFGQVYDNFIVGYLAPLYALFLGSITIPCWHTFVTCLMKYIVFKNSIIYKRLKEYDISKISLEFKYRNLSCLSEKDWQYWQARMCKYCICEQTKMRWFTKEFETLISISVFMNFIIFSVLICFLFYAISATNSSNMDYFFFAIYLFEMVFLLWLYHWHATLVTNSNDRLCFGLYSSPWYKFPLNVQKDILLMMKGPAKPLVMKAIFVELNIKTLLDVVRGAYSYFSILKNTNLEQ